MNIALFGGTTEGRILAEYCNENEIDCAYFTATKAGSDEVSHCKNIKVCQGRLDENAMLLMLKKEGIKEVYDATHPYAVEVSKNIKNACEKSDTSYIRVKRTGEVFNKDVSYVKAIDEAIRLLNTIKETILVTTGSKDAEKYTSVESFQKRIFLRILPDEETIERLLKCGYEKNYILTGKGPFTEEENIETIRDTGAKILVTKDSGKAGGFAEKVSAAKKTNCKVICIERPNEIGIDIAEAKGALSKWRKKHI